MAADPRLWTKTQVLQWLNWAIHEFSLENVVRSQFCLSGARLLQLSRDEFLRRAPPFVGDILFEHLEVLQKGSVQQAVLRFGRIMEIFYGAKNGVHACGYDSVESEWI